MRRAADWTARNPADLRTAIAAAFLLERTGDAPGAIVEARGMKQVSDTGAIEAVVAAVLEANPAEVESYRAGKTSVIGFFVGQVMREMRGQGNPAVVNEVLRRMLG